MRNQAMNEDEVGVVLDPDTKRYRLSRDGEEPTRVCVRVRFSLELAYDALRAVLPDRRHGCLCDKCLEEIVVEHSEEKTPAF